MRQGLATCHAFKLAPLLVRQLDVDGCWGKRHDSTPPRCRAPSSFLTDAVLVTDLREAVLSDELLSIAADRDLQRLDEKLFLDAFNQQPRPAKAAAKRR